ncbi:hypothetical protein LEN26_001927 [Aphanomyces euteiches]|nr:hypothetical protein AeMF1_005349 [Aphanomyces euteiches]KAH9160298.1 hypothetical protein LEN26_001927 [Aphanomyces euteiches]
MTPTKFVWAALCLCIATGYGAQTTRSCGLNIVLANNSGDYANQWCVQCTDKTDTNETYKCAPVKNSMVIRVHESAQFVSDTTDPNILNWTANFAILDNLGDNNTNAVQSMLVEDTVKGHGLKIDFKNFTRLQGLSSLYLEGVNVVDLSPLVTLTNLSITKSTLPSSIKWDKPAKLQFLSLKSCNFTDDMARSLNPQWFASLSNIDLSGNNIRNITSLAALAGIASIQSINVQGNPIDASTYSQLPPSVASKFLRDTTQSPSPTVVAPSPSSTEAPSAPSSQSSSTKTWPIIVGIVVGVVLIGGVAMLFLRRRHRLKEQGATLPSHSTSGVDEEGLTAVYNLNPLTTPRNAPASPEIPDHTVLPLKRYCGYEVVERGEVRGIKLNNGLVRGEFRGHKVLVTKFELTIMPEEEAKDNVATSFQGKHFAQVLARVATLSHPNILPVVAASKASSASLYAIFDTPADATPVSPLTTLLHQPNIDLTWSQQLDMCLDIANAIDYLHSLESSLPSFILTSSIVVVSDTGERSTCYLHVGSWLLPTALPTQQFGTNKLAWTAPEMLVEDGRPRDEKAARIFSLGVLFGEIATRRRPYVADWHAKGPVQADIALAQKLQASRDAIVPHDLDGIASIEFKNVIAQCLERDPKARPTAKEVVVMLTQCRYT